MLQKRKFWIDEEVRTGRKPSRLCGYWQRFFLQKGMFIFLSQFQIKVTNQFDFFFIFKNPNSMIENHYYYIIFSFYNN